MMTMLNSMCTFWHHKLIDIAFDDANMMIESIDGVVTKLEYEVLLHVHMTWSILHQMDFEAKVCLNALFDKKV